MKKSVKFLISFLVVSFCLFFLILGVAGPKGLLYNKSLTRILNQIRFNNEKTIYELEGLKEFQKYLTSDEALRKAAIQLGYYVEGEDVFLISNGELQSEIKINNQLFDFSPFKTLERLECLYASLIASLLINVICLFLDKPSSTKNEIQRREISATSFNDDLIEEKPDDNQ